MNRTGRTMAALLAAATVVSAGPGVSRAQEAPRPAPSTEPGPGVRVVGVLPADDAFGREDLATAVEKHQERLRQPRPGESIEQLRRQLAEAAD